MSFRTGRALPGDVTSEADDGPDDPDDPALAAVALGDLDPRPLLGALLVILGGLLGIAVLIALGLVVLGLVALREVWAVRALRRVRFERGFQPDRVMCGDNAHLVVAVSNRKRLPLPWLRTEEALPVELRRITAGDEAAATAVRSELVNDWTIGPRQKVTRRIDLRADRRGVYRFDGVTLSAGDLFGEAVAEESRSQPATLIVRPRTVAVRRFEAARDQAGTLRTIRGLTEDPSRFAGVRPYAPGDAVRHVHWRATARLGIPVVKRFDPSRDRDVVIALDIQTTDGTWAGRHDDDLAETLCVIAASLARSLESDGAACGLAVAAFTGTTDRIAFLGPGASERQAGRIGDLLARISPYPSAPFEHLLGRLGRLVRPGTLVIVVSARDPGPYLAVARRLVRSGYGVFHIAIGPDAAAHAGRSQATGLAARSGRLDAGWQTARTFDVAG